MISIIMPVYNAMDTLTQAFQSALKSGVSGQEFILVDDGSSDGSWEAICAFQAQYPNVVALKHDRNRGGGAARNTGVRAAKHPLIFVLDSDDILVENGLETAALAMSDTNLDGVATGQSVFFKDDIETPEHTIQYRSGMAKFADLISHAPSPVTGNLLFRKTAFEKVGGYPEHHGFDTQSFGFRLLANNLNIRIAEDLLYYQRLPHRPSYYVREARAGNTGRNWFYIYFESLYKFSPEIRRQIMEFDYSNPRQLAKGCHLSNVLANSAASANIFCEEGRMMDDELAYAAYEKSPDETLQAWCAGMDLRRMNLEKFVERLQNFNNSAYAKRTIYPLLAAWSRSGLGSQDIAEIQYFFGEKKSLRWWSSHTYQRILNRLDGLFK